MNNVNPSEVEHDVRYIRNNGIPSFAENGFRIRELAYYQCFLLEKENTPNSREPAMKALIDAIKQDQKENSLYKICDMAIIE